MDFKAIRIVSMAVSTLMEEIHWAPYGAQGLHTPVIVEEADCRRLDLLIDMLGTLTRMLDTRITFLSTEGKVVREWVESILELGHRYRSELELQDEFRKTVHGPQEVS
jgi:hypothetical protein